MTKNRLESFSDGVLAIILTIMVLELKVPPNSNIKALLDLYPHFISYGLSFGLIAIYWANHHHLMHTVTKVGSRIIWLNIGLLFSLSFIPFTTGWMGQQDFARTPVVVYIVNNLWCAVCYYFFQRHILYSHNHESELTKALKQQSKKGIITLVINLVAIPISYIEPLMSLPFLLAITIMWAIPDKNIERALR